MKNKPVIGITPLWDEEKNSYWMLPGYINGIIEVGGIPIILPISDSIHFIDKFIEICDGFLFTGGQDVSPEIYGSTAKYENIVCCKERDNMEINLLKSLLKSDKPLLGICRGIQIINSFLGGTLYQDLPFENPSKINHHQSPPYDVPVHYVTLEKNSPLYQLLKTDIINVNSYHHQAINKLSPNLNCMARSTDGIVEAVYMPDKKFVWAVQWHPELSYQSDYNSKAILKKFVESCS